MISPSWLGFLRSPDPRRNPAVPRQEDVVTRRAPSPRNQEWTNQGWPNRRNQLQPKAFVFTMFRTRKIHRLRSMDDTDNTKNCTLTLGSFLYALIVQMENSTHWNA